MDLGVDIIGVPADLGCCMRGANMAPAALRNLGLYEKLRSTVPKKSGMPVRDLGDVAVPLRESFAAENVVMAEHFSYLKDVAGLCEKSVVAGRLPLVIGGDHSLSLGVMQGIAGAARKTGKRWGLVWVDAHGDAHSQSSSGSGYKHGMVLGDILRERSGSSALMSPDDVVILGLRSVDRGEREQLQDLGVKAYSISEIRRRSLRQVLGEVAHDLLERVDELYLSWDLDSLDPALAPGVSTPVGGGLNQDEAFEIAEWCAASALLGAMDVVEWNPLADDAFRTGRLALDLIHGALGGRAL